VAVGGVQPADNGWQASFSNGRARVPSAGPYLRRSRDPRLRWASAPAGPARNLGKRRWRRAERGLRRPHATLGEATRDAELGVRVGLDDVKWLREGASAGRLVPGTLRWLANATRYAGPQFCIPVRRTAVLHQRRWRVERFRPTHRLGSQRTGCWTRCFEAEYRLQDPTRMA